MGNAGIPWAPRPISRHSVVTGITDRAYLPAYEKLCRPLPALLLTLALMCENVNAAPQGGTSQNPEEAKLSAGTTPGGSMTDGRQLATDSRPVGAAPFTLASDMPPFKIADPMCNTGFTISMRYDTRNSAGTIIKSVWVRKCTKGKITYGGKV